MKFLSKKKIFLLSLLFLVIPMGAVIIQETCGRNDDLWCRDNWSLIGNIGKITFWPSILFLITSLITYPLDSKVFESWKKFAFWATPLTVFLTYIAIVMGGRGSGFGPNISIVPFLILFTYGLFFFISLIIIAVSCWRNR